MPIGIDHPAPAQVALISQRPNTPRHIACSNVELSGCSIGGQRNCGFGTQGGKFNDKHTHTFTGDTSSHDKSSHELARPDHHPGGDQVAPSKLWWGRDEGSTKLPPRAACDGPTSANIRRVHRGRCRTCRGRTVRIGHPWPRARATPNDVLALVTQCGINILSVGQEVCARTLQPRGSRRRTLQGRATESLGARNVGARIFILRHRNRSAA
jgi:hypothetical protein